MEWDPNSVADAFAREVTYIGIFDGYVLGIRIAVGSLLTKLYSHGGSAVSQYLRQELHGLLESVHKSHIPDLYLWIKELGGYFKRFKGGALAPWINGIEGTPELDLEARTTLAFFEVGALVPGLYHSL